MIIQWEMKKISFHKRFINNNCSESFIFSKNMKMKIKTLSTPNDDVFSYSKRNFKILLFASVVGLVNQPSVRCQKKLSWIRIKMFNIILKQESDKSSVVTVWVKVTKKYCWNFWTPLCHFNKAAIELIENLISIHFFNTRMMFIKNIGCKSLYFCSRNSFHFDQSFFLLIKYL